VRRMTTTRTRTPWKAKIVGSAAGGWPTQSELDQEKQGKRRVGKEKDGIVGRKRRIATIDGIPVEKNCCVSLVPSTIDLVRKQTTACFEGGATPSVVILNERMAHQWKPR
jgi:hypothetical protein